MDRTDGYRRLVRVAGGAHTILAQDSVPYPLNTDQLVTIEAAGPALGVYVDGEPVFGVQDTVLTAGKAGLYCHADATACFTDARIDDFRLGRAHRISILVHHLAGDELLPSPAQLRRPSLAGHDRPATPRSTPRSRAALAAARPATAAPGDDEAKAYESLATLALGQDAAQYATRTEATRVLRGGAPVALLVRSPEPIDWARPARGLARRAVRVGARSTGRLKMVALATGSGLPAEASVSLLVRDTTELDGRRIEALAMPGGVVPQPRPTLYRDSFATPGGVLLRETFGTNALDAYTIVDQGMQSGPSQWSVIERRDRAVVVRSSAARTAARRTASRGRWRSPAPRPGPT